ncbi:MAG: hypothetical protein AMXMBFR4_25720 [Candidatus Hydrogenedentota bacterium]
MRFETVWLDGYGRFSDHTLTLHPGLQVLVGPNEQGKSTLRHFLTDMLYGQKRSTQQRVYEESNELRRPWNGTDRYSGRLSYVLDDGRVIEVQRNFDKRQESIVLFDKTHMQDITAQFERYRNREPNFAEAHLGVNKAVFIHTATIGPMSLEDLGDDDALAQIRERILSLADTSDESGTAESALKILAERSAEIGRPAAHSKRPLPVARARLAALDQELVRAKSSAEDVHRLEQRRKALHEELAALRTRKAAFEDELRLHERRDRAKRLDEALTTKRRIDDVTQTCFLYSAVREFPLEQTPEVQRAANAAATAKVQVERTENELAELKAQLNTEAEHLGPEGLQAVAEVPEPLERALSDLEGKIVRLREKADELERDRDRVAEKHEQAQRELDQLPDFSRMGADPVSWLTQLNMMFRVGRQTRNSERDKLLRLREEVNRKRTALEAPARLFARFTDFPAEARDYEVRARVHEERSTQLKGKIEQLRAVAEEYGDAIQNLWWYISLTVLIAAVCAGIAYARDLPYVYIAAGVSLLAAALYVLRWFWSNTAQKTADRDLLRAEEELLQLDKEHNSRKQNMEKAVKSAGYQSLRELESLYERYVKAAADLKALEEAEARQAQVAREEQEQVAELFGRLRQTFAEIGEPVETEDDVDTAAGRAMAKYQEYRDAKRRLGESRDRPAQLQQQLDAVRAELDECQREEVERALEARRIMREAGFRDEARYTNVLAAVQAFKMRTSQLREKYGRIAAIGERIEALSRRLEAEKKDCEKQNEALRRRLAAGGVDTIERWHESARQATMYRDAWEERTRLQEKLDVLLRDESIEELRLQVEREGRGLEPAERNPAELKAELERINATIENCTKEEHDLHIAITQRQAGQRSLNEIEEERSEAALRLEALELEQEATAYAHALIEEVARDKHARIAPRVASLAGRYLDLITGGVYREVLLSRDLRISVRIPQTERLAEDPQRRLSKGTVDQIYLALRLALVRCLSATGESIPLLLDDPFANYDDARLANALRLLSEIAKTNQILLFTCRQDVACAAAHLRVPVLTL